MPISLSRRRGLEMSDLTMEVLTSNMTISVIMVDSECPECRTALREHQHGKRSNWLASLVSMN